MRIAMFLLSGDTLQHIDEVLDIPSEEELIEELDDDFDDDDGFYAEGISGNTVDEDFDIDIDNDNIILSHLITLVILAQKPETSQQTNPSVTDTDDDAADSDASEPVILPSKGKGKQKKLELVPGKEGYVAPSQEGFAQPALGTFDGMLSTFKLDLKVEMGRRSVHGDDDAREPNSSSNSEDDGDGEIDPDLQAALHASLQKREQEDKAQGQSGPAAVLGEQDLSTSAASPVDALTIPTFSVDTYEAIYPKSDAHALELSRLSCEGIHHSQDI